MENKIKKLSEISMPVIDKYGSKAAMLGELAKAGFCIPLGFVLPIDNFDNFLRKNNFPYKSNEYTSHSPEIRECLRSYTFDQDLYKSLNQCVHQLKEEYPEDEIIVRTSALCEDSRSSSMAGVFTSFPGLKTIEEVQEAVKGCYISLFSDSVLNSYAEGNIAADSLKAGIIIQRYIKGDISGVMFTADAVEMDPGTIKISCVNGLCSGLTSGSEYVTTYTCEKGSSEVKGTYGEQQILEKDMLQHLIYTAKEIEKKTGYYQDIEWTYSGNRLYILQTRPITNFKDIRFPSDWKAENNKYKDNVWTLTNDKCFLPLIGELVKDSNNSSGSGAYDHGMDWDSVICMNLNGYMYRSKREIPNGKERLDALMSKINTQFDNGEDEFDKHIKPELSSLVDEMHRKYIDKELSNQELSSQELLQYLNDAHFYMKRSNSLHWRATTSEWYLGHFFRKRIEKYIDEISAQDLIDMVYSKSTMIAEREELYKIAKFVQENAEMMKLFTEFNYDSIIAARLERMTSDSASHLLALIKDYSCKYGWIYTRNFNNGLSKVGTIPIVNCINQIRRYLHINIDDYYMNIKNILDNAKRLKEIAYNRCLTTEDRNVFEMAVKAGEKAFLAGDDHAYYICSRKFVYLCDSLLKIAAALVKNNIIDNPYDIHYLYIDEIKDFLVNGGQAQDIAAKRKNAYTEQCRMRPPKKLGNVTPNMNKPGNNKARDLSDTVNIIKGESGSKRTVQGIIHKGFSRNLEGDDIILLLEHGHEGDLTTVLGQIKGVIMKMGTPACHMGIIARELNIPAIYGIGPKANLLKNGDKVEIRGETGEILLLEQLA